MEYDLERLLLLREGEAGSKLGQRQTVAHQTGGTESARGQQAPYLCLFGEAARVGADQALLVLEQVVEREARGFAGAPVGEQNRRAPGPQRRERRCRQGAAADTVEDRVGTATIQTGRSSRREELGAGRSRGVRTELERPSAAVVARVDDDDADRGAEGAKDEEVEQSHAAGAEDDRHPRGRHRRESRRRQDRALRQAAQDAGRRLEEDGVEVVEAGGDPARGCGERARPDDDSGGESPRLEEVLAEQRALRLGSGAAVEAGAASGVVRDDEAVTGGEASDLRTESDHLADDLVPEHGPGNDGRRRQLEQVGAAEAAPAQSQDELAGPRLGVGQSLVARLAAVVDRDSLHPGVSFHQMERRIHRRLARRIELRFWRPGEVQGHTAYSANISQSGLFLNTAISLMPGERLRLEIVDRENGFVAEGRVARIHRVALALRQVDVQGVGVRFLLPEELVEALVPQARQAGPVTQGGRQVAPARFDDGGGEAGTASDESGFGDDAEASVEADAGSAEGPQLDPDRAKIVPVQFADPSSFLSTFHRDISAGGLFVSTPHPMALHEVIWIEMQLPIPGERPRLFAARVVQRFEPQAAVGSGRNFLSGMAVQFVEPEKVLSELKPLLAVLRR